MRGSARIAWAAAIVAVTLLIGLFVTSHRLHRGEDVYEESDEA